MDYNRVLTFLHNSSKSLFGKSYSATSLSSSPTYLFCGEACGDADAAVRIGGFNWMFCAVTLPSELSDPITMILSPVLTSVTLASDDLLTVVLSLNITILLL